MCRKAQINQIRAEDSGAVELDVGRGQGGGRNRGNSGGHGRGTGGEEEEEVEVPVLIHWCVTGAGCVAI